MLDKKARGVKHWPEGERLRERPTDHGPATLAMHNFSPSALKAAKLDTLPRTLPWRSWKDFFYCFQLAMKN